MGTKMSTFQYVILGLLGVSVVAGGTVFIYVMCRIVFERLSENRSKAPLRKAYIDGHLRSESRPQKNALPPLANLETAVLSPQVDGAHEQALTGCGSCRPDVRK